MSMLVGFFVSDDDNFTPYLMERWILFITWPVESLVLIPFSYFSCQYWFMLLLPKFHLVMYGYKYPVAGGLLQWATVKNERDATRRQLLTSTI